jgi:hypothetical protein
MKPGSRLGEATPDVDLPEVHRRAKNGRGSRTAPFDADNIMECNY